MSRRTLLPIVLWALAPAAALGQQPVNPIHPLFAPLDAAGRKVRDTAAVSVDRTCGACHDAAWIGAHSGHASAEVKATCVQCHMDGSTLEVTPARLDAEGRLRREHVRIGSPRAENCGACHGLIAGKEGPLAIPEAFERPATEGRTWSLTMAEGAIVSPQRRSDSFLNLAGKADLTTPWDVHAAKLVDCVACHYAANNPARTDAKHATLRYLTDDPRRQSTAEFLVRPDHRLTREECRGCHDPMKAHDFLPYRERHMSVLACQACHIAGAEGPTVEMVDATVVTPDGSPAIRYRNVERAPGEGLNTATIRPFQPLLVERPEADGALRLAPVNPVSRFRWVSGADHAAVPQATVAAAFLEGGQYARAVLDNFDANKDGRIDAEELRLDSRLKTELIAWRLAALGVEQPTVEGTITTIPLAHGVPTRDRALRDCEACHAADSRLSEPFTIAGYLPGGKPPTPAEGSRVTLAGVMEPTPGGGLALRREGTAPGSLHVLGHTRESLTNTLGFWIFVAVFLGVTAHGLFRVFTRRHREDQVHAEGPKAYVFGRYERIWHWTMALSGLLLVVSGIDIHNAGRPWFLALPRAVSLHNVFAVVLMVNAGLSLFYHLTTKAIRNFIPAPHGFLARVLEHMTYQSRGIFFGGPHPSNAPGHKLNPLQQVTYLALLNVLFPVQIVTGLLIWAAGHWPSVALAMGGLHYVAPLHNFSAWLFLAFFVLHVYLVTTGRHPVEHLESMITGYQALEHGESTP